MGRRAKHKQGAPAPYVDAADTQKPSAKKLGKRKAEDEGTRNVKKMKAGASEGKSLSKGSGKGKENAGKVKGGKKGSQGVKTKRKEVEEEEEEDEDEDVEMAAGGSSEGWEDVEEGVSLKVAAK